MKPILTASLGYDFLVYIQVANLIHNQLSQDANNLNCPDITSYFKKENLSYINRWFTLERNNIIGYYIPQKLESMETKMAPDMFLIH